MTNSGRIITASQVVIILLFSLLPLFFSYPYRINIFLSWEGAYRLMNGEIPFRDFGLPMGYAYWMLPALFFKLFGPKLFTLIICQVLINIIGGLTFIGILRTFKLNDHLILIGAFVYGLTYIFLNYWPWYNHSAFIFGQIGLYFSLRYILVRQKSILLILAGLFSFISFWTKQDYGGLFLILILILLTVKALEIKKIQIPALTFLSFLVPLAILFTIHYDHDINYWFNYGQPPHSARIMPVNFLHKIFGESFFEKTGLLILTVSVSYQLFYKKMAFYSNEFYLALTVCGIICVGLISKVTSVLQLGNDAFIYGYIIVGIIGVFNLIGKYDLVKTALSILVITLIASQVYWGYASGILRIPPPVTFNKKENTELNEPWVSTPFETFKRVKVPKSTMETMLWLQNLNNAFPEGTKVLNMTELTPLNHEFGWSYEKGTPLWFHYRVSIFDKETEEYCKKIRNKEYGMVLFENIPNLNNFYPEKVRDCLRSNYKLIRTCAAPRQIPGATIEIYVK